MKHYFDRTRICTSIPKPCWVRSLTTESAAPPEEKLVDYPPENWTRTPMRGEYWEMDSKGQITDGFLRPPTS